MKCNRCGVNFHEFLNKRLLGCEFCYEKFSKKLCKLISVYRNNIFDPFIAMQKCNSDAISRTEELVESVCESPLDLRKYLLYQNKFHDSNFTKYRSESNENYLPVNKAIMTEFIEKKILLKFRIRLARNFAGIPFLNGLSSRQKENLLKLTLKNKSCLYQLVSDCDEINMPTVILDENYLKSFKQRKILSADCSAAIINKKFDFAVFAGDEDHIRFQWLFSLTTADTFFDDLQKFYLKLEAIDDLYLWQYNLDFGYLTACPLNSGSGIRISFMMDLGNLCRQDQWIIWKSNLHSIGFDVRGEAGENSPEESKLQISNRFLFNKYDFEYEFRRMLGLLFRLMKRELDVRAI